MPGTHFRNVSNREISVYHHIVGKTWVICNAGTIIIWNSKLWHGARTNNSNTDLYMFKLRINPSERQILKFNTNDLNDEVIGLISFFGIIKILSSIS